MPSPTTEPGACCAEGARASSGLSRRTLLKALGGAAVTLTATEAVSTQVALAAPGYTGDVLVVLSLRGGFDGLSAVVPAADADYARLRPTIGVPQRSLLPLDATFGLHPAMAPLLPLWRAGTLAAVHGVGQPNPSRSHFAAMEEMERAAPGTSLRTGWLDRTLGLTGGGGTFSAVQVGGAGAGAATSLLGPHPELTLHSVDGFSLAGPWDDLERRRWSTALSVLHREGPPTVAAAGTTALAATGTLGGLPAAPPGAGYPKGDLGTSLSDLARLIKGGVGVQVAAVDHGDWDMHAGLGRHDGGWMTGKLTELAQAMAAFSADLGPAMSGVTVLTLSEFGRRAAENGSGGLDHGHGNLVLVMGGGVVGGRVHGRWPGLGAAALDDGALAGTTDYRTLVGEVLQKRCGAGSLADVFPGYSAGATLGVVRPR
jgi:uncharacterized protein (DUF1501 family)